MSDDSSSSTTAAHTIIQTTTDSASSLIAINTATITKLTPSKYLTESLQLRSLLEGYDLFGFLDDTKPCPAATINTPETSTPNPAQAAWIRQDKLLFSAILGALSLNLQPLLSRCLTSQASWQTLKNTYGMPSRGRIRQIKEQLKTSIKGSTTITEYMQTIRTRADELALLGKTLDDEYLIDTILAGLGDEFKGIIDAVRAQE